MQILGGAAVAIVILSAIASFGLNFLAFLAAVVGAAASLAFTYKMMTVNRLELRKNQRRARTFKSVLLGQARTRDDWMPDARVQGGMIYNKKRKRIEVTGKISNDSLDRAFK